MSTDNNTQKIKKQYRGTAIIHTPEGILMNAMKDAKFILPGGGANRKNGESRIEAVVREVREEMALNAFIAVELFTYIAPPFVARNYQDHHKVFYVRVKGVPKPSHEVKHIGWYGPGMKEIDGRQISGVYMPIIEEYLSMRKANPALFEILDGVKKPE